MEKQILTPNRILIVEDHSGLRKTIANWVVELFPGIIIHQASTGEESVTLAREIRPDIVLMDIGLPGISGLEATKEIIKQGLCPNVVMLTILDGSSYEEHALEAGARAFITKGEMYIKLPVLLNQLITNQVELK